jgi:hypothetical protein
MERIVPEMPEAVKLAGLPPGGRVMLGGAPTHRTQLDLEGAAKEHPWLL